MKKESRIKKFFRLKATEKIIFAEALFYLFFSKLLVVFVPFRKVVAYIGVLNGEIRASLHEEEERKAARVKLFILMVSNNVTWSSVCLDQALATMFMLSRRKIPHSIYLGVKKNLDQQKMDAHAWIICGGRILIGGQRSVQYNVVATFSKQYV